MAKVMICAECGCQGKAKTKTRGSILIELILWICFLIPGLIYTLWRHTSRHSICHACNSKNLIPLNSPRGKKLAKECSA